ncbi:GPI inositol-deacylase [Bombina bombina]|uniref:GPI inositol-deacylase n=1 Tax=Bombina bombina TaxID=8345 RepID=UPI00235AB3D6|nr:GPI inositol-deacylase [Bombina bombina]
MKTASAVFNGILLLLVALGVRDIFFMNETNRCSMTYMFEYPEYQKIPLPKKVSRLYPAYELYLYGEGIYAARNKNMTFSGIPVLFIPGNAGSYKQARSIGSIALRKAENIDNKYHFDIFTVNLNEELVALYGGSLQRQTEFVHICIKTILRLYKGQEFPSQSVVIIGHSMGGLVARALLTLKTFKPELLNLIITQATPHIAPVLPVDSYLIDFYTLVNNYWTLNVHKLQNLTMLSVAGGYRDFQVRSGLTFLPDSNLHKSALSVVSSAVPRTWASTDHLSIVWCKELILATTRALFDMIDANTKQITVDPKNREAVLNYHFVKHPAKWFELSYETAVTASEFAMWIPVGTSKWNYTVANESSETFFTFPLSENRKLYTHLHCKNTFMYTHSWIFGCDDTVSPKCLQLNDLSWKSELLPVAKIVTLNLKEYQNLSHIVLHLPATNGSTFTMECEFFLNNLRTIQVPVPHVLSFGLSSSRFKLNSNGLYYIVQLQEFGKIYQGFHIDIEKKCTEPGETKSSIYRFQVPWSHEDLIRTSSDDFPISISAKLHAPQPENDSSMVTLLFYTSADCSHEVAIYTSFTQVLGQILRFHAASLPVHILSNILLAYGAQLGFLLNKGHCIEFESTIDAAAKPYKVDPIINICRFLLGYTWFRSAWDGLLLPELDAVQLHSMGLLFPLISVLLFLFGTCIAYWTGVFFRSTLKPLSLLWIALKRSTEFSEENRVITQRQFMKALFLAVVSWYTCGAFALLIVFFRYFLKVIKLYSMLRKYTCYVEKVSKPPTDTKEENAPIKENITNTLDTSDQDTQQTSSICDQPSNSNIDRVSDTLKMHITIMNLLLWVTLLCLPSFIYWLKNLRCNLRLDPDPSRYVALILIFILEILMHSSAHSIKSSKWLKTAAQLQLPVSILVVAFGSLHLYRVPYFITFSLCIHVLCCFT